MLARCDDMSAVHALRSRTSKHPVVMHLLRSLYFFLAEWDIALQAEHIPGARNVAPDAISRPIGAGGANTFLSHNVAATCRGASGLDIVSLEEQAERLLHQGIAVSTTRTYKAGITGYLDFCRRLNMDPAAAEEQLMLFVTELAPSRAISTIWRQCGMCRLPNPLEKTPRVMKGIQRRKPVRKDTRLPITPVILRAARRVRPQI